MYNSSLNTGNKNINKKQNNKSTRESMWVDSVKVVPCHYCMH